LANAFVPSVGHCDTENENEEEERPTWLKEANKGKTSSKKKSLPNPGGFSTIDLSSRRIFQMEIMDGFQLKLGKILNHRFMLEHHTVMGTSQIPLDFGNYLHALLVHVQPNSHMALVGRIDTWKQMEARVMMPALGVNVICHLSGARPNWGGSSIQIDGTHKGTDYVLTTVLTGSSRPSGRISYMQSLTRRLAIGGMLTCKFERKFPCDVTLGARLKLNSCTLASKYIIGKKELMLSYHRKVNRRLAMASTFTTNLKTSSATVQAGCIYTFRQAQLQATIDSNKVVRMTLLQALIPNVLNFNCCAELDHDASDANEAFKVGYGFSFGGTS